MVIDDCETKPDNFPDCCDGCPWSGRCKFTIKPDCYDYDEIQRRYGNDALEDLSKIN